MPLDMLINRNSFFEIDCDFIYSYVGNSSKTEENEDIGRYIFTSRG